MNKFIKKLFTVAMTLSMVIPNILSVVKAQEPLEYGKTEQHASDGNVLLDVKGTDVTVETSGTEQTISGNDGTRQEIAKGSVIKATGVNYFVVFHKDGSYETFTGDVEYQTNENTAYVSILSGVSQKRSRKRRDVANVNTLAVGDTFSGTFGTNNEDAMNTQTFYVDAVTGLLAQVADQIIGSQYVTCQEYGYIGLTNVNAWSLGQKAEYTYNATVTAVAPDGTVTLSIDVPHYLKPGTDEEATGWSAIYGGTVPYQRCAGTWTIKTAPRTMSMYVRVHKHNGNPEITKNNECYAQDLSGAVYGVFSDELCTNKVGEMTTDANGNALLQNITVNSGSYLFVKELKAPKGFALDSKIYPVYSLSTPADGWDVNSTDMPMNDPVAIKLTKKSADKVENPASLEGAEFTVKYYAGQYTKETLPENATRTWVIKTVKKGNIYRAMLGDEYKVSGDDFYLDNGIPTLPLGTITVEETKAPEGYTLKNKTLNQAGQEISDGVALFNIESDAQNVPQLVGGNEYTIEEGVSRGQFSTAKVDKKTGKALEGAKFKIVNKNNYDVVLKDENDKDIEVIKAGTESNFTFGTDENGKFTGWDNMLQAGSYALREVQAPRNYKTAEDVEFIVEHGKVSDVKVADEEKEPKLGTQAHKFGTGSKLVAEGQMKLEDVATFKDVRIGEYNYTTTLIAKGATEAEDEVVYQNTELVNITDNNGELKKVVDVDTTKYGGKELVFYEELVNTTDKNYVVSHKNRNDEDQTIKVTKIRTEATDDVDGDHLLDGTKEVQKFTDKIYYRGLEVGKKYTSTATLMNPDTGKPFLVDGKEVTKTVEFTPEKSEGTMLVPFEVSGIKLAGKKYVVFEDVYDENGIRVGMHHDLEDEMQTMRVSMLVNVKVIKVDANNQERKLSGAEFTVFNQDGSVATDKSGNKLVGVTDANGEVTFKITYNDVSEKRYIQETKAPEGYILDNTKHEIKVGEDYKVTNEIVIKAVNQAKPNEATNDINLGLVIAAGVISLVGIVILIKKKKEN